MSKNNFKKEIQSRYKGRGNSWVKVPFETKAYSYVKKILDDVDDETKKEFLKFNQRENFSWMRFKKVIGTSDEPITVFEVRIKGSKIDQPEYEVSIPDCHVSDLELLGNTPLKLQLETDVKDVKSSSPKVKNKSTNKNTSFMHEEEIEEELRVIKEAALTKPTDRELDEWYTFLKANDLYEESAWQ